MNVKKFFANLFVLLLFACGVFYVGWIQFQVKPGHCAVMTSRTSGLYEKPIENGKFVWKWERLLPTNVSLELFDLNPVKFSQTCSGKLSGADLYAKKLGDNVDFSYSVNLELEMKISAENIHSLVKENKIKNQEDLNSYLDNKSKVAATIITDYFLEMASKPEVMAVSASIPESDLEKILASSGELKNIDVVSCQIVSTRIPDVSLYNSCRKSYEDYVAVLSLRMEELAKTQAKSMVEQERLLNQLDKLGSILSKYPQLDKLYKEGDVSQLLNLIRTFE